MLAVAVLGVGFLIAMFGLPVILKIMDAYMPGGVSALDKQKMEMMGKMMETNMRVGRSADSQMIAYLQDAIPREAQELRMITEREYKFQRGTQTREHEFQLEALGETRAASREELLLNKLLPGGPTAADLMAQSGRELLQAGQGIPAMLPFDPNFPVTALPGTASRVSAGTASFEIR